jgi:hypothetical protein
MSHRKISRDNSQRDTAYRLINNAQEREWSKTENQNREYRNLQAEMLKLVKSYTTGKANRLAKFKKAKQECQARLRAIKADNQDFYETFQAQAAVFSGSDAVTSFEAAVGKAYATQLAAYWLTLQKAHNVKPDPNASPSFFSTLTTAEKMAFGDNNDLNIDLADD